MCGIAGFHVKDPAIIKKHEGVELFVDELFKGIEHRGKHASGFVSVGFDGKVTLDKAAVTASDFIKDRQRVPDGVRTALLHTRYWTKGDPKHTENNHPVIFNHCFAVHNGHINNDDELFEELELKRNAEVDSIAIPALLDYHGFTSTEDIRAALESLEGGFATAIIDPVAKPGRLVLAKGTSSPLYIIDHPSFLVWASTIETIKNAWGKVLGTPPNDKKIERIEEGNFLIVDDTEIVREKFTVKRRPFVARQSSWTPSDTTRTNGSQRGNNGSSFGFGQHKAPTVDATPVVQAREAIQAFIKAGGAARTFEDHENGLYDDDDFKDVVGNRKWHPCYGCNRYVLEEDRVKHPDWGTVCCDCYTATKREIARAQAEMQDTEDDDVCAGTNVPRIAGIDRDALEVWADHEMALHREVIEEMYRDLGSYYSPQAIEFLAFYTTPEYREVAGDAVNSLITELRDLYEETYLEIACSTFEGCAVPPREEESNDHPLLLEAGAQQWGFCHEHNRAFTRSDGGCPQCISRHQAELEGEARLALLLDGGVEDESEEATPPDAASTEVGVYLPWERGRDVAITHSARSYSRSSGGATSNESGDAGDDGSGEVIELPRCGQCGTFVLRATEESCAVCKKSAANDESHEVAACVGCSQQAELVVGYAGKNRYYCKTCYRRCGKIVKEPDNGVHLCNADTNHTLKDGVRVCHIHARRQSEVLSDTTLKKRGATITEVG